MSLISMISMGGIALGIAALITIVSIMNGFEGELRERILGMAAHITITAEDAAGMVRWTGLADAVARVPEIEAVAPFIDREAMLTLDGSMNGCLVRGIIPALETRVAVVGSHMRTGSLESLEPGHFHIVLGAGLAETLQARVGDAIVVVVPDPAITPAGLMPRMRRFTVSGIFEMGIQEHDTALALVHLDDAARLFRTAGAVSGLRLKLRDVFAAPAVKPRVLALIGREQPAYRVADWTETHENFFRALKTEKIVMFLIVGLVIAVAAFNMVSTLVMVVTDKQSDIAILRTLGMSARRVMRIFFVQGAVIGVVGIAVGIIGGVVLALNVEALVTLLETLFHFKILSPDVYYVSDIPSDLHARDIVATALFAAVLCLGAPLYPAWLASRTLPAEVLRGE